MLILPTHPSSPVGDRKRHLFGSKVISFVSIDSTNRIGKELLAGEDEGTVILAEYQTAGRGRLGRSWVSRKGENLTFSLLLKPPLPLDRIGWISLYAGLAVCEAIEPLVAVRPECKWPNDVLLDGKKCCGILAESAIVENRCSGIVLGIGLNVNQETFPEKLDTTATSLRRATGETFDLPAVLGILLRSLERRYGDLCAGRFDAIRDAWISHAPMMGRRVVADAGAIRIEATAEGIDESGRLLLRRNGSLEPFSAGDISLRYDIDDTRG